MKTDIQNKLFRAAAFLELLVGFGVLLACVICGVGIVCTTDLSELFANPAYFQSRLAVACYIIIGIEFIKMIASHTLDSVIDVMLLAVARQMIIEHTMPLENLLAVLAVAVLFVVRKYLYISQIDRMPNAADRPQHPLHSRKAAPAQDAPPTVDAPARDYADVP